MTTGEKMSPHHQDSEPIAYADEAPRCQHVRLSGARCGSPALRGKRFCRLHQAVVELEELDRSPAPNGEAIALQFALMQVMRLLEGRAPDYKACRLMLYALQISRANLKNFAAERRERARSSNTQPAARENREEPRSEKKGPRTWIN
ncbi:MAG: hypothetical protein ACHP7P_00355 [Terriglobales bacterium]